MPIRTHTCLTVTCNACGQPLHDFEFEAPIHFDTLAEALKTARHYRWSVVLGDQFVCTERDADHQAFLDKLMPPEPVMQMPGQLGFDGSGEPA